MKGFLVAVVGILTIIESN